MITHSVACGLFLIFIYLSIDFNSVLDMGLTATEPLKKKRGTIDYNALSRHGYSGGLSVLKVPLPKVDDKDRDWSWSTGEENKQVTEETYEEREKTRAAAASRDRLVSVKEITKSQSDKKDRNMSFSQKEKRKRDLGQASRGKSYVEEEKRLLRESGVYSSFDC